MIWSIIRAQFEGYHKWEDAFEEVEFLSNLHRHIFHIELWIEQKHSDRDVEYITEKKELEKFLKSYMWDEKSSCEMIGLVIKNEWEKKYPGRKVKVYVFEDNENGCLIE